MFTSHWSFHELDYTKWLALKIDALDENNTVINCKSVIGQSLDISGKVTCIETDGWPTERTFLISSTLPKSYMHSN